MAGDIGLGRISRYSPDFERSIKPGALVVHSKPRYLPATAMLDFVQDCVQRTSIFFCVTKTWWVEGRESKGLQWEKGKYGNGGCIVTETRESPTSSPLSIRIYATIRSCCSSFLDRMPRGACLCSLTRERHFKNQRLIRLNFLRSMVVFNHEAFNHSTIETSFQSKYFIVWH